MREARLACVVALSLAFVAACAAHPGSASGNSPRPSSASAATPATLIPTAIASPSAPAPPTEAASPTPAVEPPSPRIDAATTYDSARGELVVFGGFDSSNNYLGDTWLWSGSWTRYPGTGPSGRRFAAMAFDPAHKVAVLYGGTGCQSGSCSQLHDTWLWNGSSWLQVTPAHSPQLSPDVMAYDPSARSILMFGFVSPDCPGVGATCPSPHAETWGWNGSDWTQLQALDPSSPIQRLLGYQFAMSHDPTTGRMILLGHVDASTPNTWAWDGSKWSLIGQVGPQGYLFSMAEHAASHTVVAVDPFGTWTWDGQRWNQLGVQTGPGKRQESGIAYDDHAGRVLLFGGLYHDVHDYWKNDLWSWDGHVWSQLA